MDTFLKDTIKPSMTYGVALGIVAIIFSLFLYFFNIMPIGITKPILLFIIQVAIFFFGILYFSKSIKKEVFGGTIDYKQALMVGILIGFFTSIITSAYTYLQNYVIDPDYMTRYLNAQAEWTIDFMYRKGVPEESIDEFIRTMDEKKKEVYTFFNYIKSVAVSTLGFSILSLITAALVKTKKSSNPFAE